MLNSRYIISYYVILYYMLCCVTLRYIILYFIILYYIRLICESRVTPGPHGNDRVWFVSDVTKSKGKAADPNMC